jgi:hypothetical protein
LRKSYESRHIFMVIAIGILLLSPIFVLILPLFVANTLYFTPGNWYVMVSGTVYIVYSIGFLFIFLSAMILALLDSSKVSIFISIACLVLSGFSFMVASQDYTSLGDDSISYRGIFSKEENTYSWNEIERVVYNEVPRGVGVSDYEFYFKDGKKFVLAESGIVEGLRNNISIRLSFEDIEIENSN